MTNKRNPEVRSIGQVRSLDPALPMVRPDGAISLESIEGGKFQIETIGKLVAIVLSSADQGMTPLEAVCCTYIAQQLYAGKEVKLTPDIAEAIIKAFTKKLDQGLLQPHAHAIITWIVRPEDDSLNNYREALDALYDGLEAKKKAAGKKIAELNAQAARAALPQTAGGPQAD